MAEGTNVGKLTVTIDGDTRGLEKATGRTRRSLDGLKKDTADTARRASASFTAMATAIAPAIAAVVSLAAAMTTLQRVAAEVTALDNLSQSTGIAIGRLDELNAIAQQTGIQFETMAQAAQQFGQRITEQLSSPTSAGSIAIRTLGIDIRDTAGNIRDFGDLLPELAHKFSTMEDGSNKAALAAALLGEEVGPKLIPLLNRGRRALERFGQTSGRTLTPADAANVRAYNEAVGSLQTEFDKLSRNLSLRLIPYLTKVAEILEAILPERGEQPFQPFNESTKRLNEQFGELFVQVVRLQEELEKLERWGGPGNLLEIKEKRKELDKLQRQLEVINNQLTARAGPELNPDDTPKTPGLDAARKAADERIKQAQFELANFMERLQGTRSIFDEMNFQWETHAERVEAANKRIRAAFEKTADARREMALVEKQLNLQQQQQILDTASVAAQAITQLWPKEKGAAIASAVINTAVGVTKALTSGVPPWNIAQAALVAAAGAAQIAQIRSMNQDGSGGGGAAAPAATSAPAPAPASDPQASAGPAGRALFVQGLDPAALFTGRMVEDLIRNINNEVQNGATLISTRNLPI